MIDDHFDGKDEGKPEQQGVEYVSLPEWIIYVLLTPFRAVADAWEDATAPVDKPLISIGRIFRGVDGVLRETAMPGDTIKAQGRSELLGDEYDDSELDDEGERDELERDADEIEEPEPEIVYYELSAIRLAAIALIVIITPAFYSSSRAYPETLTKETAAIVTAPAYEPSGASPDTEVEDEQNETPEVSLSAAASPVSAADIGWWENHPVFSLFPKYTGEGGITRRFANGPEDLTETLGYYQFKILNVTYEDYKTYLQHCLDNGHVPHDPFKGFVETTEIEAVARGGYAVFVIGNWRLNLYYRGHADELIFQIEDLSFNARTFEAGAVG